MPVDPAWSRAEKATSVRQRIVSPISWIRSHHRYALLHPPRRHFADHWEEPDRVKVCNDCSENLDEMIQTITSRFERGMNDALNAEIFLGTVSNINDAVQWLGYTYLFVRARKNPMAYGMTSLVFRFLLNPIQSHPGMLWDDVANDPRLGAKRNQLVTNAVRRLVEARMVNWNRSTGGLQATDLGRIAAKYYIRLASIEVFNERFKPRMTEADVLTMLSYSTEVGLFCLPSFACPSGCFVSSSIRFNCAILRRRSWRPLKRKFLVK